jgi:hypothetical protein
MYIPWWVLIILGIVALGWIEGRGQDYGVSELRRRIQGLEAGVDEFEPQKSWAPDEDTDFPRPISYAVIEQDPPVGSAGSAAL